MADKSEISSIKEKTFENESKQMKMEVVEKSIETRLKELEDKVKVLEKENQELYKAVDFMFLCKQKNKKISLYNNIFSKMYMESDWFADKAKLDYIDKLNSGVYDHYSQK